MSVDPRRQREHQITDLAKSVEELDKSILDHEYVERLVSNPDWAKFCAAYRKDHEEHQRELDQVKDILLTRPMGVDEQVKVRERAMLLERDRMCMEDFLGFPARVVEKLKEARQQLDVDKERLRKLRGEG
jgi:hypothetical protein